jgi:hypothetical protein
MGVEVGEGGRKIHNRGLHYLLLGLVKPDGSVYQNSECEWKWLSDRVSKAARWLGYVPFTQITDQRNAEPDPRAGGHLDLPAGERNCRRRPHDYGM